jgi:hypothetical protein
MTEPTPEQRAEMAEFVEQNQPGLLTDLGITVDTDPDNPVNRLPQNTFPIGAALTIAYGSNERPFCTLGNLYRILGYLTGDVPGGDSINPEIERCRNHVEAQLPDTLRAIDPPPDTDNIDTATVSWLAGIANKYGSTIELTALPGTINNPTPKDTDQNGEPTR